MAKRITELKESFENNNEDLLRGNEVDLSCLFRPTKVGHSKESIRNEVITRRLRNEVNSVKELLNSDDALQLVQPIVMGAMLDGTEPDNDIASLFPVIRYEGRTPVEIPMVGEIEVRKVDEGNEYPMAVMDFNRYTAADRSNMIKYGARIPITEEMIEYSDWDIIGLWLRKAGRAMLRYRNRMALKAFYRNAHTLFDNLLSDSSMRTRGIGPDGSPNLSLHFQDILEMQMAQKMTGFNSTTLIMNALAWPVFVQNEMMGSFGTFQYNRNMNIPKTAQSVDVSNVEDVMRRSFPGLPTVMLSEDAPIDVENKRFDLYVVDENEIGAYVREEDIQVPADRWSDPARDLINLKVRAKEMVVIYNDGRAITAARNIAMQPTHNTPQRVVVI